MKAIVLAFSLTGLVWVARQSWADEPEPDPVIAPVTYQRTMLVVTSPDLVAAITFEANKKEAPRGATYKFRMLSGGKETTGSGVVFEKTKVVRDKQDPGKALVFDLGSKLVIRVGKLELKWSVRDEDNGWVYYFPEKCRIHLAFHDDFKTIDLARFK
ncbi:MAG: hypothetical protein U0793_12170 [Gemmataceae bacterium]